MSNESDEPKAYFSYLLRLWQEYEGDPWRASLEEPGVNQRLTFANTQALFDFLISKTGTSKTLIHNQITETHSEGETKIEITIYVQPKKD